MTNGAEAVLVVIAFSLGCAPASLATYAQKSNYEYCVRKSCTGPSSMQARDYERCLAVCRERYPH